MSRSMMIAGLFWLASTHTGCDVPNPIQDRYRDCWDSSYDVGACRDRCEGYVDADGGMSWTADACDSCLDAHACSESFACIAECSPILP